VAERIDNFTPLRGRPAIYPWERWMDGSMWRIHRGSDFEVSTRSMAQSIRERGRRDGVQVSARQLGEAVEFRFQPADPVEFATFDEEPTRANSTGPRAPS
jgi:hypothetical protein